MVIYAPCELRRIIDLSKVKGYADRVTNGQLATFIVFALVIAVAVVLFVIQGWFNEVLRRLK